MTRIKGGVVARKRRKKVLKEAKGYFGSKHRLYKTAHEQVMNSGSYAFRDRRQKKREFRKLWIARINAACKNNDITYSRFINGLTIAGVYVNRKMLSELAIDNMDAFKDLVQIASAPTQSVDSVIVKSKASKKEVKEEKVEKAEKTTKKASTSKDVKEKAEPKAKKTTKKEEK